MPELGEFHLQLALEGARPLGEDVQDQAGPVQHPALEQPFQITLLAGTQAMVEEHQFGIFGRYPFPDLLGLARPDEILAGRRLAPRRHGAQHPGTRGPGEFGELVRIVAVGIVRQEDVDQEGPFAAAGALKQYPPPPGRVRDQTLPGSGPSSCPLLPLLWKRTLRAGTTVEMACLYTIWLTLFLSSTTNWSKDSIWP